MALGEASNRIAKQEVFKRYGVHNRTLCDLYLGKVNIKIVISYFYQNLKFFKSYELCSYQIKSCYPNIITVIIYTLTERRLYVDKILVFWR